MLPIVIGIGATILALTVKSTITTISHYSHLTPTMIATMNNIRLVNPLTNTPTTSQQDPRYKTYEYIRKTYPNRGFGDPITESEALLILGIEGDDILSVDKKMVRDRYRKLMILNHPDKNGSEYISKRLNEAKDVLDRSYMIKK
ncbi:Mitochondrial DnaJ 2 [Spathaspora sp. JA1]|nr:Mitochondrial DnaJ 2 [Spathaspora sp. JA1]